MACNRGHSREQFHKCWGHMFCRGQSDVRNRVAGTFNACHAGMRQMRECASAVFGVTLCRPSPSVLDLTCSVYHISPRRACSGNAPSPSTCGNAACAAAISSLDTATLSLMKTGFTVSPRPQRVLAGACTRSKRVCMTERSGVQQGVQKGCVGGADADAATTHPVQACHALPDSDSRKAVAKVMKDTFNYWSISDHATECCLPASTVKLTPPTLDTCDGAYGRFAAFVM